MKIVSTRQLSMRVGTSLLSVFSFEKTKELMLVIQDPDEEPLNIIEYNNQDQTEIYQPREGIHIISVSKIDLGELEILNVRLKEVIDSIKKED